VKKLERRSKSRTHKHIRLYKVGLTARVEFSRDEQSLGEDAFKLGRRIDDIDVDEHITLISVHDDDAIKDLRELKTSKPKVKRVVIQEPSEFTTTTTTFSSKQISHDKGKAKMVDKPVKPKKKEQIRLDEEVALKLQAEFVEEERLARERELKNNLKPTLL
nr:hypothetical protein [Tanacetum cinerariifolium]